MSRGAAKTSKWSGSVVVTPKPPGHAVNSNTGEAFEAIDVFSPPVHRIYKFRVRSAKKKADRVYKSVAGGKKHDRNNSRTAA